MTQLLSKQKKLPCVGTIVWWALALINNWFRWKEMGSEKVFKYVSVKMLVCSKEKTLILYERENLILNSKV